jgi:cobalt-precorrin-5B (C1)-methyltransferase
MNAGRTGFTTGTCAAAAAKAATLVLCGKEAPDPVDVGLPDGTRVMLPLAFAGKTADAAEAGIKKDAGDDPDVTDGCLVVASVTWTAEPEVRILAGEGVGTVTKPGLSVNPGEPAINPVPRLMIRAAIAEVTDRPVQVTLAIPRGRELAEKTFNPRLGIEGGLSILGTSGIVRPFSSEALRDALHCTLSVAKGCAVKAPVFVPGRIGEKAARRHFRLTPEQLIEVSNEWGFILDEAGDCGFERLLVLGHPGKLAKLVTGQWDTHSSRSVSAVPAVQELARTVCGFPAPESKTVEGVLSALDEQSRETLANELARRIRMAVSDRIGKRFDVSVVLVNMRGDLLGRNGDLSAWQRQSLS